MLRKSLGLAVGITAALSIAAAAFGQAHAKRPPNAVAIAKRLSRHAIGANPSWRRYDEAPTRALVRPVRVIRVKGDVKNPQALTKPGSGKTTTLTYTGAGTAPSLILDYGKDVGGWATFDVAATSGTTIQTTYSETLVNLGNDGAASTGAFFAGNGQRSDDFTVATPGTVTAPLIQGGERYELVTLKMPGTVTLRGAGIKFSPLRETPSVMQGHFLSSDHLLNRVWYASVYTLNLNQLTPGTTVEPGAVNKLHLLLDGAKRDRAVWSGDHMISDLTDYYASDSRYARDSLTLLLDHPASSASELTPTSGAESQPGPLPGACSPNPQIHNQCITWSASYSMAVMPALYHYYLYTGDLAFVRQHWQSVVRQMEWDAQQVDSNGLFSVSASDDADWNIENVPGELTYVNGIYELALKSAAKLAKALGLKAQARQWLAGAASIRRAVNTKLWDRKTGVYDASTSERGSVVQDANVTAILAGIPAPTRAHQITRVLARALSNRFGAAATSTPVPPNYTPDDSPYMGSFNLLADFVAGNEPAALSLLRREWGFMLSHDPGGVDWERIQPGGVPKAGALADSAAHAWSTGPVAALSEYVLGVAPAGPGYGTWTVAPQPGDLRWAQGVVPTPHGSIAVRWRREGRRSFVLTLDAPRGTAGNVEIPLLGRARPIARDGRLVWNGRHGVGGTHARRVGGYVEFLHVTGSHTYAW
jgi:hypothetical protein